MDYPLFVYGSLRSGSNHKFALLLRETSEFVSTGTLRGSLYKISIYPGWVEDSAGWVMGEIYQPRDSESLLLELDAYEGPEYARVKRIVETANGPRECWAYLFIESINHKERVTSGDWFE